LCEGGGAYVGKDAAEAITSTTATFTVTGSQDVSAAFKKKPRRKTRP
jgi:hypothetical protein